ncbi:MAG: transcription antitermination factor NusB [Candidatus Dormibacteraeota bacterium]|uniref:Transcription antitermination protein NusB n=1 Tax=Candidatus Amunia macphersoniae TaxID=3127014 RepID=A0A934NGM8_9BACT|nr:transcription antitermination factor NusB [Candidatus Dormibacteraeota bacterium]
MSSAPGGGRRRRGRELALRVLFELEGTDKDAEVSLAYQADEVGATTDIRAFARRLVVGCLENRERIDAALAAASRWSLGDVGKVERAVLRLGTCELMESDGTPVAVIVDESLELTRAYAGEDAVQYVNGVLGHIARERV